MFKRLLSLLVIASIFNLSFSFELKQKTSGGKDAGAIHQTTVQSFSFLWDFLDGSVQNSPPLSLAAIVKHVTAHATYIPALLLLFTSLIGALFANRFYQLPQSCRPVRIKLLPEHDNYLFRLNPF